MKLTVPEAIMREAMRATGLSRGKIISRDRNKMLVRTRQAMMYALRERTGLSSPQIARALGLTDHTTVLHGIAKTKERIATDQVMQAFVAQLLSASREINDGGSVGASVEPKVKAVARPAPKRRPEPTIIVPAPRPPKPVFERISYEGGRFMQLDDRGECDVQRFTRNNMLIGSEKLAKAIIAARAGA